MNNEVFDAIKPIVLIALVILGMIFALAWVFGSEIRLSNKTARKIEIFGYLLLVVLLIWEFVIKNICLEQFYNDDWVFLNEKLKIIYTTLNDILTGDTTDVNAFTDTFFQDTNKRVEIQLLTVDIIEAVLQILSTICIAVGRFHELKKLKQEKTQNKNKSIKVKIKKRVSKSTT